MKPKIKLLLIERILLKDNLFIFRQKNSNKKPFYDKTKIKYKKVSKFYFNF